jgi:hypothetical protein
MQVALTEPNATLDGTPLPTGSILSPPLHGRARLSYLAEKATLAAEKRDLLTLMKAGLAKPADDEAKAMFAEWQEARAAKQARKDAAAKLRDEEAAKRQAEADAERLAQFEQNLTAGTLPPIAAPPAESPAESPDILTDTNAPNEQETEDDDGVDEGSDA